MAAENVDVLIRQAVEGAEDVRRAAERIRGLGGDADKTQAEAEQLTEQLNALGNQRRLISQFASIKRQIGETGGELAEARVRARGLGKEYNATEKPTAKLTREFERARKEVRELAQRHQQQRRTLQELRGSLDGAGISSKDLAGAEQRISRETDEANRKLETLRGTLERTESGLESSQRETEALRRDFDQIGVKPFQDVEREVKDTQEALERLRRSGRLTGEQLERATDGANRRIAQLRGTTDRAASSTGNLAGAVGRLGAAFLGGAGLIEGVRGAIRTISGFDQAMAQVQTITRASADDMQRFTALARELGSTTQFTSTQAAQGIQFLARAGFETEQILSSLPNVLNLAEAEAIGLGEAADITSNIMSGFNVEAERSSDVTDALVRTSQSANTNVTQLGQAMASVAPIARSLNISVEETSAAIGVLSNNGIQAERAGTGLRGTLASLSDVTPKAKQALAELGLTADDVNPRTNALSDVIRRLEAAGLDANSAFQIFGREAAPAVLALTSSAGEFDNLTQKIRDSQGAAADAAETTRNNLIGDFNALKSAAQGVATSLGEAGVTGALRGLLQAATGAIRAFGDLPPDLQLTLTAATGLAAATASLIVVQKTLGPLLRSTGAAATTAAAGKTALATSTSAAAAAGSRLVKLLRLTPWGLAIAGAAGLLTAYKNLRDVQDQSAQTQERFNATLREGIDAARENAAAAAEGANGAQAAIDAIAEGVDKLTDSQRQFYRSNLEEAEKYLQAQVRIGTREQALHGETRVALGEVGEQLRAVRDAQAALAESIDQTSPAPYAALADRVRSLRTEFDALGNDLSEVAGERLQAFGDRARENLDEARRAVADARAEFPALANVSDEALARVDDGFAKAIGRVKELEGIISSVSQEALQRLGVDASEALTGVRTEVGRAIKAFDTLAADASTDARLIQAAYDKVLQSLESPEELDAFEASLQQAARAGFDVGDALETVRNRLRSAGSEAQAQGEEVARVAEEYGRLGDAAEDAGKRAEAGHRRAAGAARDQARATRAAAEAAGSAGGSTLGGATTIASREGPDAGQQSVSPIDQELIGSKRDVLTNSQRRLLSSDQQNLLLALFDQRFDDLIEQARSDSTFQGTAGARKFAARQEAIFQDVRRRADALLSGQRGAAQSLQRELGIGAQSPEATGARRSVDVNLSVGGERVLLQGERAEVDRLLSILESAQGISAQGA